ncbi:Ribonuclease H domain [Arabidopsis suecica]|uniref:Ribonuclease H domain n=1 Tax=Arabidopsis suecica TaxID=45249 RepID=A0A8T2AFC0_ARASU|nr:Ribonuclease H domain [Arabidopsis suecica]
MSFSALDSVNKIREDVVEWFDAQCVEGEVNDPDNLRAVVEQEGVLSRADVWKKPPVHWLKCNIGSVWSRRNRFCGGAWILRDAQGNVILHSRRSFGPILNHEDAMLRVVLWALESMASHRVDHVIFAFQDKALVGAVNRPGAWPSFKAQSVALKRSLLPFLVWKMEVEVAAANRGANLIAQSVIGDLRVNSYVASGHPSWLNRLFADERGLSSV